MGGTKKGISPFSAPMLFALDYTMANIVTRNEDLIRRIVYDSYDPTEYERTEEFLRSWDYNIETGKADGTKLSAKFEQNLDIMTINSELAQHASPFVNGPDWWYDAREYLADIIYNGRAGKAFGHGPWTRKRDVWKPLMKTVESKINSWYAKGLELAGIVLK